MCQGDHGPGEEEAMTFELFSGAFTEGAPYHATPTGTYERHR